MFESYTKFGSEKFEYYSGSHTEEPEQFKILRKQYEYLDGDLILKRHSRKTEKPRAVGNRGYRMIQVKGKTFTLHRAIFLYHYGWSPETIDHIDQDKLNNHIENLRPATANQNKRNSKPRNKLGKKHITKLSDNNFRINFGVGTFSTIEEADASYQELPEIIRDSIRFHVNFYKKFTTEEKAEIFLKKYPSVFDGEFTTTGD